MQSCPRSTTARLAGRPPTSRRLAGLGIALEARLGPFIRLARTLLRYREGILAAITLGITDARLEGLHSKVRLLAHRSFGFHSAAPLIALI